MKKLDKKFRMSKGKYYLTVKASPNNITMYRESKEAARNAFQKYLQLGKDCEWHGCWNGKKFEDHVPPAIAN